MSQLVSVAIILLGILCASGLLLYIRYRLFKSSDEQPTRGFHFIVVLMNLFLLAITVLLAWWGLAHIKKQVETTVYQSLSAVLNTTSEILHSWMDDEKLELSSFAAKPSTIKLTQELLELHERGEPLKGTSALLKLREDFKEYQKRTRHQGLFIIAPDGTSLASQQDDDIGTPNILFERSPVSFALTFYGLSEMVPPIISDVPLAEAKPVAGTNLPPTMFFTSPIYSPSGELIAAVSVRVDPNDTFSRIFSLGRMGSTCETYAFNTDAKLLTQSRFMQALQKSNVISPSEQSILSIDIRIPTKGSNSNRKNRDKDEESPLTKMAESAIRGNSSFNIQGYKSYTGDTVQGVWKWDYRLNIGIATEIDRNEGMRAFYQARIFVVIILAITVITAITFSIFTIFLSRKTTSTLAQAKVELEARVLERTQLLSASEHRLQTVIDSVPALIFLKNTDSQYILTNRVFKELANIPHEHTTTNATFDIVSDELTNSLSTNDDKVLKEGKALSQEAFLPSQQDGASIYLINKVPFFDENGGVNGILGIAIDISDRKEMENQLVLAKEEAVSATKVKSEFLASMSHEIRTPMNGVLGMLRMLLKTDLNETQIRRARVAHNSAESLLSLINDILDFSKVEAGKLALEDLSFDIRTSLSEIAQTLAHKSQEKGLEFILDITEIHQPYIIGDPSRIRQIVTNLLSNAIKFTSEGQITLEAKLKESSGIYAILDISVSDTGIGIPSEKLPILFDQFTQVDSSTTRQYGGTGLGLAICKKICELMGGSISVSSKQGVGSQFSVSLPVQICTETEHPKHAFDLTLKQALIVDDNASNREIFTNQLQNWGVVSEAVASGKHALEKCSASQESNYDFILIDMNMPEMNGIMLAQAIKKQNLQPQAKLLLLTSSIDEYTNQNLTQLGFFARLNKPVTPNELFDTLGSCITDEPSKNNQSQISPAHVESTTLTSKEPSEYQEPHDSQNWTEGVRILIVEDNLVNQMVITDLLQQYNLTCEAVSNGKEAISSLKESPLEEPYTQILMDCQMPEMDGYQATHAVREGLAGTRYKRIPIIAMTARAMQGDKEKCIDAGMNDYISKPIDEHAVISTLRQWVTETTPVKTTPASEKIVDVNKHTLICMPGSLHTIDFAVVTPSVARRPHIFKKVIATFADSNQFIADKLDPVISSKDFTQICSIAHSLKGSSGNLGMYKVYDQASLVEENILNTGECDLLEVRKLENLILLAIEDARNIVKANAID